MRRPNAYTGLIAQLAQTNTKYLGKLISWDSLIPGQGKTNRKRQRNIQHKVRWNEKENKQAVYAQGYLLN